MNPLSMLFTMVPREVVHGIYRDEQPSGWWDRPAAGMCRGMDKPSRSHYRPGSHPERELPCRVTKAARKAGAK